MFRVSTALAFSALLVSSMPAAAADAAKTPTFTKDIAPIFQQKCESCHRPDNMAPMSLISYEEARPWAKSIKQKVVAREMPPWYVDRNVGVRQFKGDVSLSDKEIATIAQWVDGGAPKGNPADMPAPRQFASNDEWHFGTPDLIVQLPKDQLIPKTGADRWVDVLADPGLADDRYIKSIELRPMKGFRAVHHVTTTMKHEEDADEGGTFLNEYALGKYGDAFPEGAARLMKAGTKISFNLHLHSYGAETPANVALGLRFYPKGYTPKFVQVTEKIGDPKDLDLPPNADNVRFDGYNTLTKPTRMVSYQPHMHNRGKASCLEAIYPGGHKVEMLSCVSKYQFAWHLSYLYEDDAQPLLPAGTILHVTSWYDNSASNKSNPDPDNLITYGQRTVDEMGGAWISYYFLTEEQYKQEVEARKAKQTAAKSE